ncbi:fungal-specific transcription factor domain-containing protein [Nemania abortiva]|nr:fungal-specific transcription factor domain-containing protein [Nemania abortiva]
MASTPGKTPRILACVLCQNRKIKCDRHSPCSNCVKANVPCTPSTPAPPRKRRRPNQDLQQRLARCEELLSEYTTNPRTPPKDPPDRDEPWRPIGKLVIDDDGTKFTDSHLWHTVHNEISAMREILEDDETIEDYCTPSDTRTPEHNTSLVLVEGIDGNAEEYRPSPAHAFRLWQTFIEKVNPLTKVIHIPSVQPKLVEATTNPGSIPKNVEALLFSIYAVAIAAMDERECQQQLGCGKEEAYQRFSTGCRIALMRIGILNTYDLVVLQAMLLYFFSLSGRVDRHAAWILNGVAVRIAQKMGLHRDGEQLGLPPFETEMRRRIWWQIILIDTVYALMSGLGQSLLPRSWDTKKPSNIHDADLYPTMTTLQPRNGPTDMIYCLVCYEVAMMIIDTPNLEAVVLGNEIGSSEAAPPEVVEKARRRIHQLDQTIANILDNYCDPSMGPIHELAANMRHLLIGKCRELICPAKDQPEWGTEICTPGDNLFKISVVSLEMDVELYRMAQSQGQYLWFMLTQFQVEMIIYMAGQLSERTTGSLVDRAWAVVEQHYGFHEGLIMISSKTNLALAVLVVRGWKAREAALREATGSVPTTPEYIVKLRALVPSTQAKHTQVDQVVEAASVNATTNRSTQPGIGMPWDQMLGFDVGTLDWDMFTGTGENLAVNPAGYGMGFAGHQQNHSWM